MNSNSVDKVMLEVALKKGIWNHCMHLEPLTCLHMPIEEKMYTKYYISLGLISGQLGL